MDYIAKRKDLIEKLKKQNILKTSKVIQAMEKVPRHLFIPDKLISNAYRDTPLSIGEGQTISAPHMNAMMCEYLDIQKGDKILEIGTGSGYHAALLAELVGKDGKIYTIERISILANRAKKILSELNYNNVEVIVGDGSIGYHEKSPYDKILVTAASPDIPMELKEQLIKSNGLLCIPAGKRSLNQALYLIQRNGDKYKKELKCHVRFVPLIGKRGFKE